MSLLLDIQKQLETAGERIIELERDLREYPGLPSIASNLETAVRLRSRLEAQFSEAASKVGYDICRYRAFDDHDERRAAPAFEVIADFQTLVSVVYAALKHGQKQKATMSESVERETAFGLGFSFTSSVGVVLTVKNNPTLFGSSELDDAFGVVFELASAKTPEDVLSHASVLGPGPINALYEWANDNATKGLGAEIEWSKGTHVQKRLLVQRQELSRLSKAIEETGTETSETMSLDGLLEMADVGKNKFRIQRQGLPEINGTVEPGAINEKHQVSLPHVYSVTLRKTVRVKFSTGAEETRYHLLSIDEPRKGGRGNDRKAK